MSAKNSILFLGIVFLAIGILGFFNNPVLGLFEVDAVGRILYLASGVIALFMAMSGESGAKQFAKIFGVIYAVIAVVGLIIPGESFFGLMYDSLSNNLLHLVLGVVLLGLGYSDQARHIDTHAGMRV